MMDRPPPTDCKWCGKPDADDWMYWQGLVTADKVICGACKIEFGIKLYSYLESEFRKNPNRLFPSDSQ